jgi:hypothetical protein
MTDKKNDYSNNRPFDEVEDSASVAKGLALLQAHPERDPAHIFADTPLRSSLRHLKLLYALIPDRDPDPDSNNNTSNPTNNSNNNNNSATDDDDGEEITIVDQESGGVLIMEVSPPTHSSPRLHKEVLQDGCYLIYDNASGGTLVLHYSHSQIPEENAVGFWAPGPGKAIRDFKYAQGAGGYVELIRGIVGGEKNKKKYYSGWCQFIQMAKSLSGQVKKFTHFAQGLKVDIYGYHQGRVHKLFDSSSSDDDDDDALLPLQDVSHLEAVAVVPSTNDRFQGVRAMTAIAFLEMGNLEGASLHLHD